MNIINNLDKIINLESLKKNWSVPTLLFVFGQIFDYYGLPPSAIINLLCAISVILLIVKEGLTDNEIKKLRKDLSDLRVEFASYKTARDLEIKEMKITFEEKDKEKDKLINKLIKRYA